VFETLTQSSLCLQVSVATWHRERAEAERMVLEAAGSPGWPDRRSAAQRQCE